LKASRDDALAEAELRSRVLATVSHELRNPLHAAHGLTDLLAADQLPPQADDLVRTLRRQLKSLTQVTDDLLDAARLDGGQVVMQPVPTALSEVVGDVVRLARASATRLGKEAVLDVSGRTVQGTPVWVLADTDRLRQVLSNLVGNAVKFTANGSVQLVVRADGPDVVFSVIDTGVGIPADEHEAVLKPFGIGSTAGDQRGAGLGLAVVQRIVGAMDGSLAITSAPGAGTRFDVRIPLAATDAPAAATGVALTAGLAVLVVEDNPVNQQLAQRQLDRLGLVPVIVGSGEEAIELLAEHVATEPDVAPFAVILMDQQLPGMTGTQTTQRIRQLGGAVAATPVIGVSASASSADRDAFTDAGMDAFIAKPASLGDLSAVIGDVLGRSAGAPAGAGPAASASQGSVFEGPVFEGPVFEERVLATLAEELGSSQIAASIVQTYLGELDARVASIIAPAEHGLADGRPVAHMLKSSSRLVGALPLGDVAHRIEQTGTFDADGLRSLAARTKEALAGWVARVGG
jgi:CheY-like chemotaxis protein/two-component sensor histidine kinase